jgi:hypothetical protein
MSTSATLTLSVRVDRELLDEYRQVVERDERDVSKDIRKHMRQRVERARREAAAKEQAA